MITVGKICPALVTDLIASVPLSLPAKYWVSLFLHTLCVHGKHWKLEDMVSIISQQRRFFTTPTDVFQ